MNKIQEIYNLLIKEFGKCNWWPIINDKSLLCEYPGNIPRNKQEQLEIIIGAILAQNTQWYPNVVRALQQLKLGRQFTKEELKLIQQTELIYKNERSKETNIDKLKISGNKQIITKENILIQTTIWKNVEKIIIKLNKNSLINLRNLEKIKTNNLAEIIKSSGYKNQKARKIKELIKFLNSGKEITRDNLLGIWGIGPETADSILLYAYKKPSFVIDSYTKRIMARIGFKQKAYDELQSLFMKNLPKDYKIYNEFHALLVELAKRNCKLKTPLCSSCPLSRNCEKIGL